jgi:hypothetical protein
MDASHRDLKWWKRWEIVWANTHILDQGEQYSIERYVEGANSTFGLT